MLRFIHRRRQLSGRINNISIHLMLRFIMPGSRILHAVSRISIHLMLRFIISNNSHHRGSKSISIHLMLRFILRRLLANRLEKFHFNTSHVTVYQKIRCRPIPEICYFNTSHVTVYHDGRKGKGCIKSQFQYISCYGLSLPSRFMFPKHPYFNTSHVTVYRDQVGSQKGGN